MIRSHGGIFGRNPAFNEVEIQGGLTVNNGQVDIGVLNSQTVPVILYKNPGDNPPPFNDTFNGVPLSIKTPETEDYPSVGLSGLPGNVMISITNTSTGLPTFWVQDNGDITCNNITMSGYLAPSDVYVTGKGWFNVFPNDTLAYGPYFKLTIPTSGDSGDWFLIADESDNPYVSINEFGYATFAGGATFDSITVSTTTNVNAVVTGKKVATTTSTATDNSSFTWSSSYTTVKFLIQARNATAARFQITEIVATRDATTNVASVTVLNTNTGGVVGTYNVFISLGLWRIGVTPSLASSSTFTVLYTVM